DRMRIGVEKVAVGGYGRLGRPVGPGKVERHDRQMALPAAAFKRYPRTLPTGENAMPLVLTSISDEIGTLTLNSPERHNALSAPLVGELIAAFTRFRAAGVRVVVLRAPPGARVWSAGHDVNELPTDGRD